jgi:hypothetical protein
MKHEFDNIEAAINAITKSSIIHAQATEKGDYKTANKNYHIIKDAIDYAKANGGSKQISELLEGEEVSVKVWVASFLLKEGETKSIRILEEIASKSIPLHSFNARMVLQEWKQGKI